MVNLLVQQQEAHISNVGIWGIYMLGFWPIVSTNSEILFVYLCLAVQVELKFRPTLLVERDLHHLI